MYHIYLLESQNDKTWYIGFTKNLERRVLEHKYGKGGRTTKIKKGWMLIYLESYLNEKDARGRELFLKSGAGRKFLKNNSLTTYLIYS